MSHCDAEGVTLRQERVAPATRACRACDKGVSRCDESVSRCDESVSRCDKGVSRCDEGVSRCDEGVSRCDKGVSRCDKVGFTLRLSVGSRKQPRVGAGGAT